MKPTLLHPTYFGSIAQYIAIVQSKTLVFENEDNYQKQTYRNRTYIYGANGKLLLTVPIKHTREEGRKLYRDVRIENEFKWQMLHWKSIQSAYRTSPYFEYYEDDIAHLFEKRKEYLLDFNYECLDTICQCLQLDISYTKTSSYQKDSENYNDMRMLVQAKKEKPYELETYIQVFSDKHGFIPNISILDLLFNEGTSALTYLERQEIF